MIVVVAVLSLIAIEAFLYGFSYPYFALALNDLGLSNFAIGLNASLAGLGILILGPALPRLINRLGVKRIVQMMFALSLGAFLVLLASSSLIVWFSARLVMGACFAALWICTEVWLNQIAPDAQRGRIIGASGTLYAAFQFMGPIALGMTGANGSLPIVMASLPLLAALVIASLLHQPPLSAPEHSDEVGTDSLFTAFRLAPALLAVAFITGIGETSMQTLLPIYGIANGLDVAGASGLVAVFSLGEAILILLLGWSADRFGRDRTIAATLLAAVVSCSMLPLVIAQGWILLGPTLFVAGGAVSGLYTLGVVLIGQEFSSKRLAVVSTGFAMAYSLGSVLGAAPMGTLVDELGYSALPLGVACLFGFLLTLLTWRRPMSTSGSKKHL